MQIRLKTVTTKPVARKNLINFFRRNIVDATKIQQIMHEYPETRRDIGSLPTNWLKNIDKSKIAAKTQEIQNAFANFASKTAEISPFERVNFWERLFNPNKLSTEIKTKGYQKILLNRLKGITGEKKFKIQYVDSGDIGKCFKISDGKYDYSLKTFHAKANTVKNHGQMVEVQNALFANHNSPSGRFAKFFTGRFSVDQKINDGYILSKFIHPEDAKPEGNNIFVTSHYHNYIRPEGFLHNYIKGTSFDFGDLTIRAELRDSKIRRIYQEMVKACENPSAQKTKKLIETFGNSPAFLKAEDLIVVEYTDFPPMYKYELQT